MSAGALPQTPLGELIALSTPHNGFKGATLWQEGEKVRGMGKGEKKEETEGGRGKGREEE